MGANEATSPTGDEHSRSGAHGAPHTVSFVSGGARVDVDRGRVESAAVRMRPAHSEHFSKNHEWFALVGTGLYYVLDLLEGATGRRPSTAHTARLALAELGFPILAAASGAFLRDGHPGHRD